MLRSPPPPHPAQVRINGENPAKDFQPCPGFLGEVAFPTGAFRLDEWDVTGD